MTTLTLASLTGLPAGVTRPDYDPTAVRVGIIHLGIGAFHRAHQAVFTDDLLRADPRWGICGVNLPSPLSIDALNAQDGLYTVLQKSSDGVQPRVIGSLREALFLGTDRARLMARFADPAVKETMAKQGNTIAISTSEFAQSYFRSEKEKYAKLVKKAGIELQ